MVETSVRTYHGRPSDPGDAPVQRQPQPSVITSILALMGLVVMAFISGMVGLTSVIALVVGPARFATVVARFLPAAEPVWRGLGRPSSNDQ